MLVEKKCDNEKKCPTGTKCFKNKNKQKSQIPILKLEFGIFYLEFNPKIGIWNFKNLEFIFKLFFLKVPYKIHQNQNQKLKFYDLL